MSGVIKVDIEGLQELQRALQQFTKATARRVLERALLKAAKPIEHDAENNAPVATGELKRSIESKVLKRSPGKQAFARTMSAGGSRAEAAAAARAANARNAESAAVRISAIVPHAHLVEFGTVKMPAKPFLAPAMRAGRTGAISTIKVELKREIEATAKRVAKRKAKS
ncbi:MAG: HK97 gp10 family phage protein [Mesorhizobium sp.]|nr:HK97-gp10 family putative phage morphogenesis protein [Mesorhizobium sp.]MBL8576134.1 HK97 gp10 family phage protein [Mesorhizobium sp.]